MQSHKVFTDHIFFIPSFSEQFLLWFCWKIPYYCLLHGSGEQVIRFEYNCIGWRTRKKNVSKRVRNRLKGNERRTRCSNSILHNLKLTVIHLDAFSSRRKENKRRLCLEIFLNYVIIIAIVERKVHNFIQAFHRVDKLFGVCICVLVHSHNSSLAGQISWKWKIVKAIEAKAKRIRR